MSKSKPCSKPNSTYVVDVVRSEDIVVKVRFDGHVKLDNRKKAEETVAMVATEQAIAYFKKHKVVAVDAVHHTKGNFRKELTSRISKEINLINLGKFSTRATIQFCKLKELVLVKINDKLVLPAILDQVAINGKEMRVSVLLERAIKFKDGRIANYIEVDREMLVGKPVYENFVDPKDSEGNVIEFRSFVQAETPDGQSITGEHVFYDPVYEKSFIFVYPAIIGAKTEFIAVKSSSVKVVQGEDLLQYEKEKFFMSVVNERIEEEERNLRKGDSTKKKFRANNPNTRETRLNAWICGRIEKILAASDELGSLIRDMSPGYPAQFQGQNMLECFLSEQFSSLDPAMKGLVSSEVMEMVRVEYEMVSAEKIENLIGKGESTSQSDGAKGKTDQIPLKRQKIDELEIYKMQQEQKKMLKLLKNYKSDFVRREAAARRHQLDHGDTVFVRPEQLDKMATLHDVDGLLVFGDKEDSVLLKSKVSMAVTTSPRLMRQVAMRQDRPKYDLIPEPLREYLGDLVILLNSTGFTGEGNKRHLFTHPKLNIPFEMNHTEFEIGQTVEVTYAKKHRWLILDLQGDWQGKVFAMLQHKYYDLNFVCNTGAFSKCSVAPADMMAVDKNNEKLLPRDRVTYFCTSSQCMRDVFVLSADTGHCVVIDIWGENRATFCTIPGKELTLKDSDALPRKRFGFGPVPVDVMQDRRSDF